MRRRTTHSEHQLDKKRGDLDEDSPHSTLPHPPTHSFKSFALFTQNALTFRPHSLCGAVTQAQPWMRRSNY